MFCTQKNCLITPIVFGKICISGIFALLILNCLLSFYYHLPLHINNSLHTTDYVWEKNSHWIKWTEGISWGKLDANGFNNAKVVENPDVLILGSSHMEATNVFQNENTAFLLQSYFEKENIPLTVYNHGISGHHFLKCCKYLNNNTKDDSLKYVIIETSKVDFSETEIDNFFNNKIDFTSSYTSGIIGFLQHLPLFRLLWSQLEDGLLQLFLSKKTNLVAISNTVTDDTKIKNSYNRLFEYIKENSNGKRIIIFYHPTGTPNISGNLTFDTNENSLSLFSDFAEKYGIDFIDLTKDTEKLWQTEHKTTHGFCTGTAFSGHFNRNGHKIAAENLAKKIITQEKTNVAF